MISDEIIDPVKKMKMLKFSHPEYLLEMSDNFLLSYIDLFGKDYIKNVSVAQFVYGEYQKLKIYDEIL